MDKPEEKVLYLATLVFPVRVEEVMLALKMKKIGKGHLNGYGGGVDAGESLRASAAREFFEETGGAKVEERDLVKMGVVHFKNNKSDGSEFVCSVHVYSVSVWTGEIVSTEEMADPKLFSVATVGKENLMPADPFWLPRMLLGESGEVWAEYSPNQEALIGDVIFKPRDFSKEE